MRLRWLAWMHGTGTWLALLSLLLVGSFYLDRVLDPPHAMRLVVAPLVGIGLAAALWYWVLRPMRVRLSEDDAGLLVERTHPELAERLISALQLSRDAGGASPDLVDRTIREGEEAALALQHHGAFRPAPARWRGAVGLLSAALLLGVAGSEPQDFGVFLRRLLGSSVEWPQRTHLDIEIAGRTANVRVDRVNNEIHVRIARGTDLPVRVVAQVEVPALVELVSSDGRRTPAAFVPPNEFQARFHSVRGPFQFHAEGGDDREGRVRVSVETVTPPRIAKIQASVEAPAYSGHASFTKDGGSFEALTGSLARIRVESATPVLTAILRFRDGDDAVDFVPLTGAEAGDPAPGTAWSAELTVDRTRRYSVELLDGEGLRNPDPGSYSILAFSDRPPEVRLQVPARTEVDVTANGRLAMQYRATDDFGVAGLQLRSRSIGQEAYGGRDLPLGAPGAEAAADGSEAPPANPSPRLVVGRTRVELAELRVPDTSEAGARAPREGDVFEIYVEARDARRPEPGTGDSPHVRAIVLAPSDVWKRMTERLSRSKETTQSLLAIQHERRRRVGELMDALGASDGSAASERPSIGAVLVGQNRVTTDGRMLVRDFFEALESIAANRLDRTSDAAFDALERFRSEEPSAENDPYAPVVARALVSAIRSGSLGAPEQIDKFANLLAEAGAIAADASPSAVKALDEAAVATSGPEILAALARAADRQEAVIASLEKILGYLSEWETFQGVLTATKDLVEQQKALNARTKEHAKDSTGPPR